MAITPMRLAPTLTTPALTIRTPISEVVHWTVLVRIRGRSMQPTLTHGQVLLTRPAGGDIAVGDVVVIWTAPGKRCVKRVAAKPGDVVELEAGRLYVNQSSWDGRPRIVGARVATWHVPNGHYFVVGDNPQESDDSRVWPDPFVAVSRMSGVALNRWL